MIKFISALAKRPSVRNLIQTELEDCQRSLLQHESATTYHTKMAEYHRDNIRRLSRMLNGTEGGHPHGF